MAEKSVVTFGKVLGFLKSNNIETKSFLMITFSRSGYETWEFVTNEEGRILNDNKGAPLVRTRREPYGE